MAIGILTLGQVTKLDDAAKNFNDIQQWANAMQQMFSATMNMPGSSEIRFLVQEDDGFVYQWELVAGAGITLNFDPVTRQCEITSP